jgi:hypothetical protein
MRAASLALVLAAVACGGKSSPPPATPSNQPAPEPTPVAEPAPPAASANLSDPAFDALMGRALVMFNAMGAAADQAAGDCNKLSDNLELVLNDHQGFIAQAKLYKDNPEMAQRAEAWMKAHSVEMMEPMMKLGGAAQKCSGTPKFDATMKRLEAMGS